MVSDWFYGTQGGDTHGPVQDYEMKRRLAAGELTPDTIVWCPTEGVSPTPIRATSLAPTSAEPAVQWHYERAGTRVGPVDEAGMQRLLANGTITRDTLVWNPSLGPAFVRLGETSLSPQMVNPPQLPATVVDNSLVWVLVVIPLGSAILEQMAGGQSTSIWGWPLATFIANLAVSALDEKRVVRSGVTDKAVRLGFWIWLVPVYLYQRARALKGPKLYVWAWIASFVASLLVGTGNVASLFNGDTYLGLGVPACDSSYQIRQVRKIFDGMSQARLAGLTSISVTNARELGASGNLRTCAGQINASNAQSYSVVYTVEERDDQILTNIQIR